MLPFIVKEGLSGGQLFLATQLEFFKKQSSFKFCMPL